MKKHVLISFIALNCFMSYKSISQTTLVASDVIVLHNQTDTPDSFAFVTLVDIIIGTEIFFTDCGADALGFNTPCTEGAIKYTSPGLLAGEIIKYESGGSNPNFSGYTDTRITGAFSTAVAGDQIIVFQDSDTGNATPAGEEPTFVFVSNTASTVFTWDKTDTNQTGLPLGLDNTTAPRSALGLGAGSGSQDEYDNTVYNGSYNFSIGGLTAARLALTDPSNYINSDDIGDVSYAAAVTAIPAQLTLTLSVNNNDLGETITVSPNPTNTGTVQINSTNPDKLKVTIYDLLGKEIKNEIMTNSNIDISSLNSGIYLLKISQGDAFETKRLVIE